MARRRTRAGIHSVFLSQSGVMRNLQDLVVGVSPLYLLVGFGINDVGQIAGFGATSSGDVHAFLACPASMSCVTARKPAAASEGAEPAAQDVTRPMALSEDARRLLRERLPFGLFGARPRGLR